MRRLCRQFAEDCKPNFLLVLLTCYDNIICLFIPTASKRYIAHFKFEVPSFTHSKNGKGFLNLPQ